MRYELEHFAGISPEARLALNAAGVCDSDSLLDRAATPRQRKALAARCGLPVR